MSELPFEDLQNSISRINTAIRPYRHEMSINERIVFLYLIVGLFGISTLSISLGIIVSYGIAIALAALYFTGFIIMIIKIKRLND